MANQRVNNQPIAMDKLHENVDRVLAPFEEGGDTWFNNAKFYFEDNLQYSQPTDDEERPLKCRRCAKQQGVKKCAGCKETAYCSKECQSNDWKACTYEYDRNCVQISHSLKLVISPQDGMCFITK